MQGLQKCGRKDCETIEAPNGWWWLLSLKPGEARIRLYSPGAFVLAGEELVCSESCAGREFAAWACAEQVRRRQDERQDQVLAAIEKQL